MQGKSDMPAHMDGRIPCSAAPWQRTSPCSNASHVTRLSQGELTSLDHDPWTLNLKPSMSLTPG